MLEDRRRNSQNERAVNTVPGKGVSECVQGSPRTSLTRAEKVWLKGESVTSLRVSKDAQDLKQFSKPGIYTKWGFKGKVLLWLAGFSGELSLQAVCLHIQNRRSPYIDREKDMLLIRVNISIMYMVMVSSLHISMDLSLGMLTKFTCVIHCVQWCRGQTYGLFSLQWQRTLYF